MFVFPKVTGAGKKVPSCLLGIPCIIPKKNVSMYRLLLAYIYCTSEIFMQPFLMHVANQDLASSSIHLGLVNRTTELVFFLMPYQQRINYEQREGMVELPV